MAVSFTPEELKEFLLTDPAVRILIVEGPADVGVWHYVVPTAERANCVIYSIDSIDTPAGVDGNRGAALNLARMSLTWHGADRLKFFIDADNDHHVCATYDDNVVTTDFRDLESYVLLDDILKHMCVVGAGESDREYEITKAASSALTRPVGILRVTSARHSYNLPFQHTFRAGSIKRFFKKRGSDYSIIIDNVIDALVNNVEHVAVNRADIRASYDNEERTLADIADRKIIHGKDLVAFFAWYYDITLDIASGLVRLALGAQINVVRQQPNIATLHGWLAAA
jgi:hypothetical protein